MKTTKNIRFVILALVLCSVLFAADSRPAKPEPLYLLTLKFKKSSLTLDVWQHAKNSMQAVEIVIPVDREFYDQQNVGSELRSQFRGWSLLSTGAISSYKVTVQKKEVKSRS